MKKFKGLQENIITYRIILGVLSSLLLIQSMRLYVVTSRNISTSEENIIIDEASDVLNGKYFVCIDNDIVTLSDCDDMSKTIILDKIDVKAMRKEDRRKFQQGFFLYSNAELHELLEDYSS